MKEIGMVGTIISLLLLADPQFTPLELGIIADLDALETDTAFTLAVVAENGRTLTHSVGDSSLETPYDSASTSKWVTATILLWLVQDNRLSLDDNPQKFIEDWPTTGNLSEIKLRHLLSFTSGLNNTPSCVNLPNADFENCVAKIAADNIGSNIAGEEFYYASTHMQVAGLMAIEALGVTSWQEVFQSFQIEFNLFNQSSYNLPSPANPRLAGGMTWVGREYLEFLAKLNSSEVLNHTLLEAMSSNQISTADIAHSPGPENWRYGFGVWLECPVSEANCLKADRISSPGAYGAYPFIDYGNKYYGLIARQGERGTFENGFSIYRNIAAKLADWAATNKN